MHKPAGILVSGNRFKTIANALPQNLRPSPLPDGTRPQPVHRLDYPTTGTLLIGKTSSSIRALNGLFADKRISKEYFAVAIGNMDKEGIIVADVDGKRSESRYEVHHSVASERFSRLNLVAVRPATGRRHQIRRHLSGIGNPILGDKTYGTEGLILNGKGLYLHAHSLTFVHPFTHQEMVVTSELPIRFEKLF
ncbi:RluA family pseudouridine synthase [Neolewinella aurantiaca]|uniref:RluA family pseudouridine synthase n=1 Tax=Neolewinella aurantiaca TaxID=2602767 RepID=UPI001FEC64D6|nr:RluA family pseudouridine synthase [Neolewinella aurantiaca]